MALYHAGFSEGEPPIDAIRTGSIASGTLATDAAALVLWVEMFGVRANDRLRFHITGPDGRVLLDREQPIDRTQARRLAFAWVRRQGFSWPAGFYRGDLTLSRREGAVRLTQTRTAMVQIP